jgi:hypothetical protein
MEEDDMSDGATEPSPADVIEAARSKRSRCKTCGRGIALGTLRLGIQIEGRYGTGYVWHHLSCAARRQLERVPSIETLRRLHEAGEVRRQQRPALPCAERAPSGRSTCKHCEAPIERGRFRVVLGRQRRFGRQVRTAPINVHPGCVWDALRAEDCATERPGFAQALRANSRMEVAEVKAVLSEIGDGCGSG